MKANELMIGDWVLGLVEDDENVGKVKAKHPARVTEINHNGDFSAECPYAFDELFDGDGHKIDDFVWYDVEPIPLTKEILEKNGFEVQEQGGGREDIWIGFGADCEGDIEFEFNKGVPTHLKIDGAFKGEYYISNNIKFVHQLQHALKLCGIDKQITI